MPAWVGIVQHRGTSEVTINNAGRALELVKEFGALSEYFWGWKPDAPEPHAGKGGENELKCLKG